MKRCIASTLPDGSKLTTYEEISHQTTQRAVRRVAVVYRPDGVRIIASASNGYDVTVRNEQVAHRGNPVLTTAQLIAIVTQHWWDRELPTYFTHQALALNSYVAFGTGASTDSTRAK